ncbi:MAG: hypothetical protein F6K00_13880 [Leptolyngbya sp. SIOISBB]|nr:hypothetical protein [Leptolyngbya sp. SIOISBB]
MRYLAKIERASFLGNTVLQLLAKQVDEYLWETLPDKEAIETDIALGAGNGAIVLVQLEIHGEQTKVTVVEDVVPWLVDLLDQFLSRGITPEFLAQEAERAEQWRQSLTLESQEVERRALETAARRDEIQELERKLKVDRAELEQREADFLARQQETE